VGLGRICGLFGMTRQALYKHINKQKKVLIEDHIVIQLVFEIRKDHPKMGTRKIYYLIKNDLQAQGIKMGRDALFDLLAEHNMLIRKRKRTVKTTNSNHWFRKYPNLTQELTLSRPNQLWVSDITYVRTRSSFNYLFLLTDGYSKKILGYQLSHNLDSRNAVKCLEMALKTLCKPLIGLIHHSDRGIQYCSKEYVNLLQDNNIRVSMTEKGDPRENPIAERINGILKDEYLTVDNTDNKQISMDQLIRVIGIYNEQRPHLSCNMLTPEQAHNQSGVLKKRWKTYKKEKLNLYV
jgi:transposase InsO family protein